MYKNFIRALLSGILCAGLINPVFARLTGTSTVPETCWGAAGAEVCIDSSGNMVPTTDDDADLGTSSLEWQDLYLDGTATVDAISNSGTLTQTGNAAFTGNIEVNGVSVFPADAYAVGATSTVAVTATYMTITSTGSAITMTGVVLSTPTTAGQILIVRCTTSTITISDEDTDASSNVQLGDTTRVLDVGDIIGFIWNGTDWVEMFYNDISSMNQPFYDITVANDATIEDGIIDDLQVDETMYLGLTTAVSTFTPTAITLDDGLTLTVNGPSTIASTMTFTAGTTGAVIAIGTVTAAPNAIADYCLIYSTDSGSGAELYVTDGSGNATLNSPHNSKNEWIFYSENRKTNEATFINMIEFIRDVESLTGKQYIYDYRRDQ